MKIFVSLSVYIICAFHIAQADLHQPISQNIQQEYEIAVEVSKKFQKGVLSKEEAEEIQRLHKRH